MSHKILIVDDDPSVREAIYEILTMNGYTVDVLAKPFSVPTLLDAVQRGLQ